MTMSRSSKFLLVAASAFLIGVTGCGEKKSAEAPKDGGAQVQQPQQGAQQQEQFPAGHPKVAEGDQTAQQSPQVAHSNIKTQKEVRLSDEVKAKWKEVKVEVTDASSKSKETMTLKVGAVTPIKKEGYKIKVVAFVPDYAIAENRIESRSNEPKNPAVLVELVSGDKPVARGWVFKDYPEFNSYNDASVQMKLIAPGLDKGKK